MKHALLVFSGVPLAVCRGAWLRSWLRDIPFSISAAVGFIALSGVAVLNGLVMVTFINQLRSAGERLEDAIIRGSLVQLRRADDGAGRGGRASCRWPWRRARVRRCSGPWRRSGRRDRLVDALDARRPPRLVSDRDDSGVPE